MRFTEEELQAILNDDNKRIVDDIFWSQSRDFSSLFTFSVSVISVVSKGLKLFGNYNIDRKHLSFALIKDGVGRVYGLDIGKDHSNPKTKGQKREPVGDLHKHRWTTSKLKARIAYRPDDITAKPHEVEKAWKEFCAEAKIKHEGRFYHYLQNQRELF